MTMTACMSSNMWHYSLILWSMPSLKIHHCEGMAILEKVVNMYVQIDTVELFI